jgi:pimeloyl-ACP methyl ester carboxylesterase
MLLMRILTAVVLMIFTSASIAEMIPLAAPGSPGETLALHCIAPAMETAEAVLFVHGASFPTMLAAGFEFEGNDSWMDFMASRGFLACGLDFLGFGESSRPRAMQVLPTGAAPIGRAVDVEMQISAAVDYLLKQRDIKRLHIVAHSWGTIPAALFVARHPSAENSLTLFGPIVPKPASELEATPFSWWRISARERYDQLRFTEALPRGLHLLEPAVDQKWVMEFASSGGAGKSSNQNEPLRIPAGPIADSNDATAGHYPYRPRDIPIPVFVVYGGYDTVVNDAQAAAFLARFTSSPLKWRLRIDSGTHVMHLERNRQSLYQSVLAFIETANTRR